MVDHIVQDKAVVAMGSLVHLILIVAVVCAAVVPVKVSFCQESIEKVIILISAPTCSDGVQNEGETQVDCGGPYCTGHSSCANGFTCATDSDCSSGVCSGDTCQGEFL